MASALWTPREDQQLLQLTEERRSLGEIGAIMGRSAKGVSARRQRLIGGDRRQSRVTHRSPMFLAPQPRTFRTEVQFANWCIRVVPGPNGVSLAAGMVPA